MRPIDADALAKEWNGSFYEGTVDSLLDTAPTIEPQQLWIPCKERPPLAEYGESDNVIATCGHLDDDDTSTSVRWIRKLYFNGSSWCYPTGEVYEQKVIAWMPLPAPYREGEKEKK